MGRAPCCEKMGLKRGPWTPDEDQILVSYIRLHGHSNWRALPKQAGLLRCGKSCRLRWTNYLRPDIKRGNFTLEEEEIIIKLHEMLGNRWSAIAARLPGRTDNEIKNVWHTNLKKRLPKQNEPETGSATTTTVADRPTKKQARKSRASKKSEVHTEAEERKHVNCVDGPVTDSHDNNNNNNNKNNENAEGDNVRPTSSIKREPVSPQPCTSEMSTITSTSASGNENMCKENVGEKDGYTGDFPEFNDDFWMEVLSVEDTAMSTEDLPSVSPCYKPDVLMAEPMVHSEEMDIFWYNLLTRSDDLLEFSEIM